MTWRMAKSLEVLLAQINALSPNRDKSSDGGIGDKSHQSRSSDHNAWIIDDDGIRVVSARDFTHDPLHGIDSEKLAEALLQSKDDRIKIIISNKKICSGTNQGHPAWQWRPYPVPPNKNPHDHHCHVSVKSDAAHYDDTSPWAFALIPAPEHVAAPPVKATPVLRKGMSGPDVARLQTLLNTHGATLKPDGNFGPATEKAVKKFQGPHDLIADGVVGGYTWKELEA